MATLGYSYGDWTQIIGTGDGWVTLSGTTETFSTVVDKNGYLGVELRCEVNFDPTPTDNVDWTLYPCDDGTPSNPDDVGVPLARFDKATDPNQQTFDDDSGHRYVRVGAKQTGSTDTHDVRCYYRLYRVTSS
jgi:hypothetical protein